METITYSQVGPLEIQLDLYKPSALPSGPIPALVFFHGGGMLAGGRKTLRPQHWLKDAALKSNILFISADYRLLLPSTALEIIDDVKSLFTFLVSPDFSTKHLPAATALDSTRIAVSGESGGGYPAWAAGIHAVPRPKVAFMQYGMGGDLLSDWWLAPKTGPMPLPGSEGITRESLAHLLNHPQQSISYDPLVMLGDEGATEDSGRWKLLMLFWAEGTLVDHVLGRPGISAELRKLPAEQRMGAIPQQLRPALVEAQVGATFPPTVLLHGTADIMVSIEESKRPFKKLRESGVRTELIAVEGGGHALIDRNSAPNPVAGAKESRETAFRFVLRELME